MSFKNFTFSSTYISPRVKKKKIVLFIVGVMIRYRLTRVIKVPFLSTGCDFRWTDRIFFSFKNFYFTFNNLRLVIFNTIRTASIAVALASAAATTFVCIALVYRKAYNNYTGQHLRKMRRSAGSHDRCPMACLQMDGEKNK